MISASQMRAGMAIRYQGQEYRVVSADYHPGQGKMGGVTHARLQNLSTGTFWEHSFRSDLKLEDMPVERHTLEFLYADGDQCWFMNPESFEQVEMPRAMIGPQSQFLESGMRLSVDFVEGKPVAVLFPDILEVRIADTAPPSHQQQDSTYKPAKLENGVEIMTPQFVKTGDVVRLDLRTMKYMDRVKTDIKAKGA
jgi:elongation factor P